MGGAFARVPDGATPLGRRDARGRGTPSASGSNPPGTRPAAPGPAARATCWPGWPRARRTRTSSPTPIRRGCSASYAAATWARLRRSAPSGTRTGSSRGPRDRAAMASQSSKPRPGGSVTMGGDVRSPRHPPARRRQALRRDHRRRRARPRRARGHVRRPARSQRGRQVDDDEDAHRPGDRRRGRAEVLGFTLPGESKQARAQCGVVPQLDNLDVDADRRAEPDRVRVPVPARPRASAAPRSSARWRSPTSATAATRRSTSSRAACAGGC